MKIKCFIICLFLLIVVSGCSSTVTSSESECVINYLEEKYSEQFAVIGSHKEYSIENGICTEYICESLNADEEFSVYVYNNEQYDSETFLYENKTYYMNESYAEIYLENLIYENDLKYLNDDLFIKYKVDFTVRQPSSEQFTEEAINCLHAEELSPYLKLYLLSDNEYSYEDIYKTEEIMRKYNPDIGYIYYAVLSETDLKDAEMLWESNQYDFGNYLLNSDIITNLSFSLYDNSDGFSKSLTQLK